MRMADGKSSRPVTRTSTTPGAPRTCVARCKSSNCRTPVAARFTSSPRFAFVNAWRPLKMVQRDPLAVADASTVPESDYQVRDLCDIPRGTGGASASVALYEPDAGE